MKRFRINICIWNGNSYMNLLIYFTFYFVWNWLCLLGVLPFHFGTFDLAHGWFGMFVAFPGEGSPIIGTYKFHPLSRGNPCCRIGIACAFEWGKSHQQRREVETLEGKILAAELELRVREITLRSNKNVCRWIFIATSKWGESHPGTYETGVNSDSKTHIQACSVTFLNTVLDT